MFRYAAGKLDFQRWKQDAIKRYFKSLLKSTSKSCKLSEILRDSFSGGPYMCGYLNV